MKQVIETDKQVVLRTLNRELVGTLIMMRVVGLLLILILPLILYQYIDTDSIKSELTRIKEDLNTFTLDGVSIREFDSSGVHVATIEGSRALVSKDFKKTTILDIRVIDHRLSPEGILTARKGIRSITRKVEQLNFSGNVNLVQGGESSLFTEKLYYYPQESIVESPVNATLKTTATTICGDVLQTSLATKRGTVRGNVVIERVIESVNKDFRQIVITGQYCSFDLDRNYFSVKGQVTVSEKEMKLTCNFLEYNMSTDICLAKGAVAATDPEVILRCSDLKYNVSAGIVDISASPSSATTPSASRTSFRVPGDMSTWQLTELHAKHIVHNRLAGIMDASKDVKVVRWGLNGEELHRDFMISSDHLHSVFQTGKTSVSSSRGTFAPGTKKTGQGRSIFQGNVHILSDTVGASGNKSVFYEATRNFYVIGNASAWEYTEKREKTNIVSGAKIFHDSRRKRNIVIGSVSGLFSGGGE